MQNLERIVPSYEDEQPARLSGAFSFARGSAGAGSKRYVGRSARRPAPVAKAPASAPRPRPLAPAFHGFDTGPHAEERSGGITVGLRVLPWSLRLVMAVAVLSGLLMLLRLPGLFVSPAADLSGTEATYASSAELLAGRVTGALEPIRLLPPPAPWEGASPTSLAGGLPLYTWLVSGLFGLGAGEWAGKLVALLFSALAGLWLFALVRRVAGARAALYSLLLFAVAPLSLIVGEQFSPVSMLLASKAWAMLALVRWRLSVTAGSPGGSSLSLGVAAAGGALASALDPAAVVLLLPAAYVFALSAPAQAGTGTATRWTGGRVGLSEAWAQSPHRGRLAAYGAAVVGAALIWFAFASGGAQGTSVAAADGGGGIGATVAGLFSAGSYISLIGMSVERVLTLAGLVLLGAGLLKGARSPLPLIFHAWLLAEVFHVLLDASRLPRHDDALAPLLLPACALVGIGAAWAGSLPARVWAAFTEERRDSDSQYSTSPHTAWLLDLPEERLDEKPAARPQARPALGKSVARRSRLAASRLRRTGLMLAGHVAILAAFLAIAMSGWQIAAADTRVTVQGEEMQAIGRDIAMNTPPGSRLVIAGSPAATLFYASGRTGWALSDDEFGVARLQSLQRQGAAYFLTANQDWLGKHPDYPGMLANYSIKRLTRSFVLFDLNAPPVASDRLYFLQSGHTLGGEFRRFWETHGGVAKLGYPVSEEIEEPNPLDGQTRRMQYFERAVLEYHPEFVDTGHPVMLAALGRWLTKDANFDPVPPFENTKDRVYFPQTGHSLREAFLRFWLREGGLAQFGYPISEELPEISRLDGRVYTVQYFERARLEWHPGDPSNPVQLGLLGKEALEMRR